MSDEIEIRNTSAYECWRRYRDGYLNKTNIVAVMNQARRYVAGKQYRDDFLNDALKPIYNICSEYTDKCSAKILESMPFIEFASNNEGINLDTVDQFYEYQMKKMDNDSYDDATCRAGYIDGTAVVFTAFDKDTIGTESKFRGFLKRRVVPFEDTFWENPYCEDEQDQRYIGYKEPMEIVQIKALLKSEYKDEEDKEYKAKLKLIVPENYFDGNGYIKDASDEDIDSKIAPVYWRFFRVDGEVCFEACTQRCSLFKHPHFLNPNMNERVAQKLREELDRKLEEAEADDYMDKSVLDYEMDAQRYTMFEKAVKQSHEEHIKEKWKFSNYPVSLFKPKPISGQICGDSPVSKLIPNQNQINACAIYTNLILQNHSMPKWLAKPGALKGQSPNNSPSQVLLDYSPINTGTAWGITRIEAGSAISDNIVTILEHILTLTRNVNSFDDLRADATSGESGYLFSQKVHQQNLPLMQPQKRFWEYRKKTAKIDLQYFRHYIDSASFFVVRSDSEFAMQENYRRMAQGLINSGKHTDPNGATILPKTKKSYVKEIDSSFFDAEFDIAIEAVEDVGSSRAIEAQHLNEIFQAIMAGNAPMDRIRFWIEANPSFSRKTRTRVASAIEGIETSEISMLTAENEQLKQQIVSLMDTLKSTKDIISRGQAQTEAQRRGFMEANKQNQGFLKMAIGNQKSEGEKKSDNARGIKEDGNNPTDA